MHFALFFSMIAAILLSGGKGQRMGSPTPKQYLPLNNKPIILHALDALLSFPYWQEIVVVCEQEYQGVFSSYCHLPLHFALPGKERQDSVFSGIDTLSSQAKWVCIHDGARPLLESKDLFCLIEAGKMYEAAALATPVKTTIKEVNEDLFVTKTLSRDKLWSLQTPQILSLELLRQGKEFVQKNALLVTDDVSLAELLGHKVKLIQGSEKNIKITTQEDLLLAQILK